MGMKCSTPQTRDHLAFILYGDNRWEKRCLQKKKRNGDRGKKLLERKKKKREKKGQGLDF
jgi:hypothetical protein